MTDRILTPEEVAKILTQADAFGDEDNGYDYNPEAVSLIVDAEFLARSHEALRAQLDTLRATVDDDPDIAYLRTAGCNAAGCLDPEYKDRGLHGPNCLQVEIDGLLDVIAALRVADTDQGATP